MARYHVQIESSYWLNNYPDFMILPPSDRMKLVRKDTDRIQRFLEAEPVENTVNILLTADDVSIVPLDEAEANGKVLRIR